MIDCWDEVGSNVSGGGWILSWIDSIWTWVDLGCWLDDGLLVIVAVVCGCSVLWYVVGGLIGRGGMS